jgi:hypothetical protein
MIFPMNVPWLKVSTLRDFNTIVDRPESFWHDLTKSKISEKQLTLQVSESEYLAFKYACKTIDDVAKLREVFGHEKINHGDLLFVKDLNGEWLLRYATGECHNKCGVQVFKGQQKSGDKVYYKYYILANGITLPE